MLESIDLMSLNQGYHVRYPPNRLSFDVHQAHPANHHVDYHVYHYGDKVRHHFDHYYDNKSAVHSVNHYGKVFFIIFQILFDNISARL